MRDVFVMSLSSGVGCESVQIECFVVEEISYSFNEHVELVKYDYPHLQTIYFRNVSTDEDTLEMDIFIESDILRNSQKGESILGNPKNQFKLRSHCIESFQGHLRAKSTPESDCNTKSVSSIGQEGQQN